MDEFENHQTILNKPMSNWFKGIFLTLISIFIAYPIIQFELDKLNSPFDAEHFYIVNLLFFLPLKIIFLIIGIYSTIGLFKKKKLFYLFPVLIFLGTVTIWGVVLYKI